LFLKGNTGDEALASAGKTEADVLSEPKGASWKAKLALDLRSRATARNPWIAQRLNKGTLRELRI